MARQNAFGLKSEPKATGTPASIIFLTGGGSSLRMYAVVGRMTPIDPFLAISEIPLSVIFSRWLIAYKQRRGFRNFLSPPLTNRNLR